MGNNACLGHTLNSCQDTAALCGCSDALNFETTAKAVMNMHGIESWNAKSLVKDNLRRQLELANKCPLQYIKVQDGLNYINERLNERRFPCLACGSPSVTTLKRQQFVEICWDMMIEVKDYRGNRVQKKPSDREELFEIFDSMDFDKSGELSTGEWAGGCSVFFRGSTEECVDAVFNILDQDKSTTLTQNELREYLKPFLKAMMPEAAAALQPMLLKRATETIFKEMDKDNTATITAKEMLDWTKAGHNIIDSLAELIDREVYALWMENKKHSMRRDYNSWSRHDPMPPGAMGSMSPGGMNGDPMSSQFGGPPNSTGYGGPQDQYGGYPQQSGNWGGGGSPPQSSWGGGGGGPPPQNSWGGGGPPQQGWGSSGNSPNNQTWGPGGGVSPGGGGGGGWGGGAPQPPFGTQPGQGGYPPQGSYGGGTSPQRGQGGFGSGYDQQQAQQYGSPGRQTAADHFASNASHWSNVPPPPPPPSRGGGGSRQDNSPSRSGGGGGGGGYGYGGGHQGGSPPPAGGSSAPYQGSSPSYGAGAGGGGGYGYGR